MKQNEDKHTIWKKAGITLLSLLLFFVCSGLLYVTKLANLAAPVPEENIADITNPHVVEETKERMGDYWTVAIFGVDSRSGSYKDTTSDAILLCTVNRKSGEVRLASVYRDTLTRRPGEEHMLQKISQSYRSGPASAVMALNENLDLQIEDYLTFSFQAAADAVNLLGGIDLEITKAEAYYINAFITETVNVTGVPSTPLSGPGYQHLDGVQTVAYCRLRLMDTDFQRTERQRLVMGLILEKLKTADLSVLNQILVTVLPQIETSINNEDLAPFAQNIGNYRLVETTGFPFQHEQAHIGSLNGDFVLPSTLESNVAQLHRFLYRDEDYQCSQTVREISREILQLAIKN